MKIVISLAIISLVTLGALSYFEGPKTTSTVLPAKIPENDKGNFFEIEFEGKIYSYAWISADPKNIELFPNFEEKLGSANLIEEKNCQALVSAGFYSKDGTPIGLFLSQGELLNKFSTNKLLNGIFRVDEEGIAYVESNKNYETKDKFAIQTGPILVLSKSLQDLNSEADHPARRIAVIISNSNVYFVTVYNEDSKFLGPQLKDLPQIMAAISKNQKIELESAINLDGGSASAFLTGSLKLTELTNIGSFFCIKE